MQNVVGGVHVMSVNVRVHRRILEINSKHDDLIIGQRHTVEI
jgi:hypothetical protein